MINKGICYGISVGPGESDMLTLEAINIIKEADIIFLPSFPKEDCRAYQAVVKSYPQIDEKELRSETFTMSRSAAVMAERHVEIANNVKTELDKGKIIAFLTLGEVLLYSTYLYIHRILIDDGYDSRFIPGISSVQAIAGKLSVPLAIGKEELHIFPGGGDDILANLRYKGTKVFMKPRGEWSDFVKVIRKYVEDNPGSLACGISNFGMDDEIIASGADELEKLRGYFTLVIVKDVKKRAEISGNNVEMHEDCVACECSSGREAFDRKEYSAESKAYDSYEASYDYYENRACRYYPCHEGQSHINCLFCYCPLYRLENCPGDNHYIEKDGRRIKVCTNCSFPHKRENYPKVMEILRHM